MLLAFVAFVSVDSVDLYLQVEQEDKDSDNGGDSTVDQDAGPSSGAAPSSPAANGLPGGKSAAKAAPEKTPKQGQQAEEGAAGEGRVQGTGKRGNLTETESRATGWCALNQNRNGFLAYASQHEQH